MYIYVYIESELLVVFTIKRMFDGGLRILKIWSFVIKFTLWCELIIGLWVNGFVGLELNGPLME